MKKLRIRKTPKGSPKATWKMTTPVMVPNGFQPNADPMSLYSAATGMSATCKRHHHQADDRQEDGIAAPPPAEHDGVGGEAGDRGDEDRGGDADLERGPERVEHASGRQSRGDASAQRRGRPPGEELLVVLERELGGGGEHLPPSGHLEEPRRAERDDHHGQGRHEPEQCNRAQDEVDDDA